MRRRSAHGWGRLPVAPQFAPKTNRRLRTAALLALALFVACFVLGYIACSLSAGSLEFWHVWDWFSGGSTVGTA